PLRMIRQSSPRMRTCNHLRLRTKRHPFPGMTLYPRHYLLRSRVLHPWMRKPLTRRPLKWTWAQLQMSLTQI
ncbi:Hypothetical protein FKW44_016347, partial [Caligus rogercresseyi]